MYFFFNHIRIYHHDFYCVRKFHLTIFFYIFTKQNTLFFFFFTFRILILFKHPETKSLIYRQSKWRWQLVFFVFIHLFIYYRQMCILYLLHRYYYYDVIKYSDRVITCLYIRPKYNVFTWHVKFFLRVSTVKFDLTLKSRTNEDQQKKKN